MAENTVAEAVKRMEANPPLPEGMFLEPEEVAEKLRYMTAGASAQCVVFDDSMAPILRRGDIVFLDDSRRFHIDGCIYAFHYQGKPHIKRIYLYDGITIRLFSGGKPIADAPFNGECSAIVNREDIEIVGRVVCAASLY